MNKTLINLAKAYVGESQARNRYTSYAKVAQKEGFEQIAEIFRITADQEKEHASWLFKLIKELKNNNEPIKIETEVPATYGSTEDNLQAAINGENYEHTKMYPEFAQIASQEGLAQISARLRSIAIAEKHHEERYAKILKQVKDKSVFVKGEAVWWVCRECGYIYFGKTAPKICPSCSHPQGFYQLLSENY